MNKRDGRKTAYGSPAHLQWALHRMGMSAADRPRFDAMRTQYTKARDAPVRVLDPPNPNATEHHDLAYHHAYFDLHHSEPPATTEFMSTLRPHDPLLAGAYFSHPHNLHGTVTYTSFSNTDK